MDLRNDFKAEYNKEMEEMLYSESDRELARLKSVRLREKKVRVVCASYGLEDYEIDEMVEWFV